MSGLDGTGPRGIGPMTGGRRGWCQAPPENQQIVQGEAPATRPGQGIVYGLGRGGIPRGGGRGYCGGRRR